MNHAPITLLYGSLISILLCSLGLYVSYARSTRKAYIGATADADLHRAVRVHGNAAEWVPMMIAMLLLLELAGAGAIYLHAFGIAIVAARVLHAAGVLLKKPLSTIGATLTYALLLVMPVYGLLLYFRG